MLRILPSQGWARRRGIGRPPNEELELTKPTSSFGVRGLCISPLVLAACWNGDR